jgi:hypothetical protein
MAIPDPPEPLPPLPDPFRRPAPWPGPAPRPGPDPSPDPDLPPMPPEVGVDGVSAASAVNLHHTGPCGGLARYATPSLPRPGSVSSREGGV